ncbi:hypothetical protein K2X40_02335 [Candidatus Babeliales bacterium]|nr:hypothetical protein [Candidatus Babeliales bacterium]
MNMWYKKFFILYAFFIVSFVPVAGAQVNFDTDSALVNHAWQNIMLDLKTVDGKPHLVSCTYRLADNKPISALTKIHFKDYRKSAAYREKAFAGAAKNVERVVTITYRSGDKKLSLIDHNPKKESRRLLKTRRSVAIPASTLLVTAQIGSKKA